MALAKSNSIFGAEFKKDFIDCVVNSLTEDNQKFVVSSINKVMQKNCKLLNLSIERHPYLHHKGILFIYNDDRDTPPWSAKLALQDELQDEMDNILIDREALNMDKARIRAYMLRLAALCNTVDDIFLLLPEILHKHIPNFLTQNQKNNYGRTLSDTDIAKFSKDNAQFAAYVNERIFKNFLLN